MEVKTQLVIFDFDWTVLDQNSDTWIFEAIAIDLRRKVANLRKSVQWTDLIAQCLEDLHARGVTRNQIEDSLRMAPFHPAMARCLHRMASDESAKAKTTLLCLSDANSVFIDTILEAQGLTQAFDEIITNPASWTDDGLLKVQRRVDPNGPPHSCKVGCGVNLCKGEELESYLARKGVEYDRMVYVGDGWNDFCPALKLRAKDVVLARALFGLENRIKQEGEKHGLKARVKTWEGAWEVEELFLRGLEDEDLRN